MTDNYLKVCVWNIQGVTHRELGNKLCDTTVLRSLKDYDIICITETHADNSDSIAIKEYHSISVIRPRFKGAKKNSGGITVLVKNSIKNGIRNLRWNALPNDMVWLKLDKNFFNCNSDIYMACAYLSPENSSYTRRQQYDVFNLLETEIASYMGKGKVILTGDLNARTAIRLDYLVNDDNRFIPAPCDYIPDKPIPPRFSQDKMVNGYGRKLIELCKNSGMRIVNGRTLGDLNGKFTCFEYGGSSVVDYCITHHSFVDNMVYFKVGELLGHLSDHCPISFGIRVCSKYNKVNDIDTTPIPIPYRWYKESEVTFKQRFAKPDVQQRLSLLTEKIKAKDIMCDEVIKEINQIFTLVADKSLGKRKRSKNRKIKKHKWFDKQCHDLKSQLREYSRMVSRNPFDQSLRKYFFQIKKQYRKQLKKSKLDYKEKIINDLNNMFCKNPSEYWKLLDELRHMSGEASDDNDKVSPSEWFTYFKNLLGTNDIDNGKNKVILDKIRVLENSCSEIMGELNKEFTKDELYVVVQGLKNKKAVALDNISNEMIIASWDSISVVLVDLFNYIFRSHTYPRVWSQGVITAIYKKGTKSDPNNYRGITICSSLAKLFSGVLNNRLTKFLYDKQIMSEEQISSYKGKMTIDHMYTLKSLIDKYTGKGKKLYTCFVDLRKAFDSVWRNGLLYKLLNNGIQGDFYNMIRAMYNNVLCCVKTSVGLTPHFSSLKGVRQGDVISPQLFNLYVNDVPLCFNRKDGVELDNKMINCLMFADDIILLSNSPEGLQNSMNNLQHYCKNWELQVNLDKSKIVVFNKGNRMTTEKFYFEDTLLENVKSYTYLGVEFTINGSFTNAQKILLGKANKATFQLLKVINNSNISPVNAMHLFHRLIVPICTYGAEVWARGINVMSYDKFFKYTENSIFEVLYLKFAKWMLGVNKKSVNLATRGELGLFPLYFDCVGKFLKYESRVRNINEGLVSNAFNNNIELSSNLEYNSIDKVKAINSMFSSNATSTSNSNNDYKSVIKNVYTKYRERFSDTLSTMGDGKLKIYNQIKSYHGTENYLSDIMNGNHRKAFTRLRISAHSLYIETGRYNGTDRDDRICRICTSEQLEDEHHLLLDCGCYNDERNTLFDNLAKTCKNFRNLPNNSKVIYMLSCEGSEVRAVAKFIWEALEKHKASLDQI